MVLVGHLNGDAEIFAELSQVRIGDEIRIADGEHIFVYVVADQTTVPETAIDVLSPTDDATLTLLTCAGQWNPTTGRYTERLVVRARFIAGGPAGT